MLLLLSNIPVIEPHVACTSPLVLHTDALTGGFETHAPHPFGGGSPQDDTAVIILRPVLASHSSNALRKRIQLVLATGRILPAQASILR
jgi:hypothetical protein